MMLDFLKRWLPNKARTDLIKETILYDPKKELRVNHFIKLMDTQSINENLSDLCYIKEIHPELLLLIREKKLPGLFFS